MEEIRAKRWYRSFWPWLGLGAGLVLALVLVLQTQSPGSVVRAFGALKAGGDMARADRDRVAGYREMILAAAKESNVDPYLLAGIMYCESRGVGGQTSSAGALGLMQLSKAAASDAAKRLNLPEPSTKDLLSNSKLNIRLAASHWSWLVEHRGDWTEEAVLVSYNAGRAKLKRWIKAAGSYPKWCETEVRAEAQGRKSTGALRYARQCQQVAAIMRDNNALKAASL